MTYAIGDMVAFRAGRARLIGEVCIRDRDLWGDGSDSYDIMVCSDLYRFGRDRSGCLFKHIPETAVERRMGRAVPLREGDPVHCVWREGGVLEERIGRIAELGPARAVLELRDGSTMRADLLGQGGGGNVIVVYMPSQEQIPDAAAHQYSLVSCLFQPGEDRQGPRVQFFHTSASFASYIVTQRGRFGNLPLVFSKKASIINSFDTDSGFGGSLWIQSGTFSTI